LKLALFYIENKVLWKFRHFNFRSVRESSAMALGAILAYMSDEAVKRVIQMLLTLIEHEDWQSRHGGVLGLKHYLAMSKV
jgi:hypothetical protein